MTADDRGDDRRLRYAEARNALRKLLRERHHAAFGDVLINASSDKESLRDLLGTNVTYLQQFVLCHLLCWEYADDTAFVEFCKDTLTLGFDLSLKPTALLYLCTTFQKTRDTGILQFLMSVMRATMQKTGGDTRYAHVEHERTLRSVYGCIKITLDPDFAASAITPDTVITPDMLEELDRHIAMLNNDQKDAQRD